MGRQAYLNRLAFGRGAFQEPMLDDDSNFVINPRAHDIDDSDHYVQEWDPRGHPRNERSKQLAKDFRRAKNEALEVAGIVRRKRTQTETKAETEWTERLERTSLLSSEFQAGETLSVLATAMAFGITWWTSCLRDRIQVFRSYHGIPLADIIRTELRRVGTVNFYQAGILGWLVSGTTNIPFFTPAPSLRERGYSVLRQSRKTNTQADSIAQHGYMVGRLQTAIFQVDRLALYGCLGLLLWPVRLLSQLQRLHLVLPQSLGGFSYLTPSSEASPIHNHAPNFLDWIRLSRFSTLASAVALPLLLAIAHDFLRYQIETAIYLIVRINICYPNECDLWSKQIAGKVRQYELMMTRVNLFHLPALARASSRPTTRLHETLRALQEYLPGLHVHIIRIGWFLFGEDIQRVELTPAVEARLKFRLSQIYRHKVRAHRDIWNAESVHDFRRVALERATEEQDLNCWTMYFDEEELYKNESSLFPPFEDIDIDSTATPDPQDLFVTPDFEVGNENATNASTHLGNDGDTARDARRRLDEIISQNMERGPELVVEQLTTVNDQQPVPWTVSHGNQSTPAVQQLHETLPTPVEQAVQRHNQEVGSLTQPQAADFDHSAAPGSDGPEIDRLIRSESPSPGITRAQSLVTPEAETSTATDVMATIAAMPAPIVHLTRPYYGQVIPTMFAGDEPPPNLPPPRRMNPETLSSHSVSSNDSPSEAEAVEPPPRSNGYRTTPLSNFSAEFLSAIAAKTLATLILLPLESLCLRSLTLSFLSHPSTRPGATDAASWIRSDVIPMGVWFGGPVGSGRMRYVGNLALCLGLQATMGIGVWAGFSWISERLGRKRYNWGKY